MATEASSDARGNDPVPANGRSKLATVESGVAVVAMTILCIYVCFIVANVFARYVFNAPLYFLGDLTELLIPMAMAMSFAVAGLAGSNLAIRVFATRLGKRVLVLDILAALATAALLIAIGVKVTEYAFELRAGGRATSHVQIPVWPIWIVVAASFLGAAIGTIGALVFGRRAQTTAE